MPTPYKDRLNAINAMLADPFIEIKNEGFDSLFNLWLENNDSPEFIQDLIPIAAEHDMVIPEFKNRLNSLVIKDTITETYLLQRLNHLREDIAKFKKNLVATEDIKTDVMVENINRINKSTFKFWQITLFVIILLTIVSMFLPSNIYQKAIMIFIAATCSAVFPYIFSQKQHRNLAKELNLKLNYSYPTYLSIGDENIVDISIENQNEAKFTGEITMIFDDDDSLITPVADQSSSAHIEIPPFGRDAKQFKFIIKNRPTDGNVDFYFLVLSSFGSRYKTSNEKFLVSPIPRLRSTWSWLFGSAGLGALIITLLWDKLADMIGL